MKLVSMKLTPKEKKAESKANAPSGSVSDYAYGLSLRLGADELEKLGLKELPEVGDVFHIEGSAIVQSVSERQSTKGDDHRSVEMQITDLGCEEGPSKGKDKSIRKDIEKATKGDDY